MLLAGNPFADSMNKVLLVLALTAALPTFADDVFRIEIGPDYRRDKDSDLKRRIWELERAVGQLQARVFQLEAKPVPVVEKDSWVCTIEAMGQTYTGTGTSRALATKAAMEACKAGRNGDTFFCKTPRCEN